MNNASGSNTLLWISLSVLLWFASLAAISHPVSAAQRVALETHGPAAIVGSTLADSDDTTKSHEQSLFGHSQRKDIRHQARFKVAAGSIKSEESKTETEIVFM